MNDVLVVGAGPAGNNVAYRLASLGYSVTVVDWRERIGDKLCTGIVGRECVRRFPMDESLVFRDARLAKVIAPGGRIVDFARRDHQAQVVDRVAYVASFADMARRAGDTYLLGYRVTDVSSNDEFATIQLSGESEKRTLTGRALVLASGFGSELAGQLGLGKVGDYVTGVQAEVLAPDIDEIHVYFGQDIAPGFFAWLVPTSGGRVLVGLLSRHHGQLHLEKLLLRLQVEGKVKAITKEAARWGVPLRPPARTFGERVLAIGDAAGQVKPTTGGGIYYALLASEIAADVLHRGFCLNELSASQLSHYEKEWKSLLSQEMKIGYSARRAFENLDDRQGVIMKLMGQPILGKALSLFNPVLASLASHP